ncbi:conserved hypothetical protein [Paraburkholderia tropica]|uniref:plasmid fertility inhibition factor family protein n=1 Tax=Paraburkholderia tropica TaxID=92647 RepID=UPI001CABE2F9|nr:hypothetical protein [Paraburkholderia tropica]CAG9239048.1 conserved hypothetical protein [Paraburkholderia tropica]
MQTYLGPRLAANGQILALFKVPTRQGEVYMSVGRTEFGNDERAVVEVRRDALFGLWRNDMPGAIRALPARGLDAAVLSEKIELADEGFRLGISDPVPLMEVRCGVRPRIGAPSINETVALNATAQPYLSVIDGVARALWLASQGSPCFPVECDVSEAPLLARLAGTRRSRWMRVSEMLPLSSFPHGVHAPRADSTDSHSMKGAFH